jgi:exopolysaccharide production protein ExoZ
MRASTVGTLYGALVLSVAILEGRTRFRPPRSLQFIGDVSYTVYLSHLFVLSTIGRLWRMTSPSPDTLVDNMLVFLIMFAAVVAYGWLGYRLIEEPLLRVSHRLRGRWFGNGSRSLPDSEAHSGASQ